MSGTANTTPRVHVHVPLKDFHTYLPFLRERRLSMEIYFGTTYMDSITVPELQSIRDAIDWDCTISVHGPFLDLCPGALDTRIAAASLGRFLQTTEFAKILRPDVVVFHSGYEKWKYAGNVPIWLEQSLKTWRAVMPLAEASGIKIAIENIVDAEPDHLKLLADEMAHPLFGLCLDVGHRELFSKLTPAEWVEGMLPHIFELHLHDNLGEADDHMPIGDGRIDFGGLFDRLRMSGLEPVYTLEAHSPEDAVRSLEAIGRYI